MKIVAKRKEVPKKIHLPEATPKVKAKTKQKRRSRRIRQTPEAAPEVANAESMDKQRGLDEYKEEDQEDLGPQQGLEYEELQQEEEEHEEEGPLGLGGSLEEYEQAG